MFASTRRDASALQRTILERKLQWLGRAAGAEYAEIDGREYLVDGQRIGDPASLVEQAGQLFVGFPEIATDDDGHSMTVGSYLRRALPVPPGTYARLAAKDEARKAKRTRPARPLDALASHPLLARRPETFMRLAEGPTNLVAAALSTAPRAVVVPGSELKRGVAAILEAFRSRGVELALTPAGTMYASGSRLTVDVQRLIEQAGPLLHAHLQGVPLECDFAHHDGQAPEAVSLLVGGAACCAEHLEVPE